jgi:hypothetical protein
MEKTMANKKVDNKEVDTSKEEITITKMDFFKIWTWGFRTGLAFVEGKVDEQKLENTLVDLFEKSLQLIVNVEDEYQQERIALISKIAEIKNKNE